MYMVYYIFLFGIALFGRQFRQGLHECADARRSPPNQTLTLTPTLLAAARRNDPLAEQ